MALRLLPEPNLPVELSSFCGRRREIGHLRTLLATDRLVTVTGTGGVGKTRLAMELAHGAVFDFPAGVWVVELARIGSDELVGTAIAEAIAAAREGPTSALDRATRRLSDGRQLLILDNCEHVRSGAAEASWHLLTHCSGLTILTTSREALDVRGERVVPLLPLQLAEPTDSHGHHTISEAMQLFCDRAQLLDANGGLPPGTAADVADICRRLDGLPLALELAAAWVPVLSLKQVRDRLDGSLALLANNDTGRPTRHRSIRAALEWSLELLTPAQATAFAKLSVFVGGVSLDGAEAVLDEVTDDGSSTLDLVSALVSRSLIVADTSADEARYRMLEPVRQYAAEQLQSRPGDERGARARQLLYLTELCEAAEGPIAGGPGQPWLDRVDAELDNIRAALSWGFGEDLDVAARMATSLTVYCWTRGLFDEGLGWARHAARSTGRTRARALLMAGWCASQKGDTETAERDLDEAHRLIAQGKWPFEMILVLHAKCVIAYVRGDLDALKTMGDEGLRIARASGDEAEILWALWAPSVYSAVRGDNQRSLELLSEALDIIVRIGNESRRSSVVSNVIETAIDLGDWATASHHLKAALDTAATADPAIGPYLLESAAIVAIQRGDHTPGLRLLGASRAALTRVGYREAPDEVERRRRWIDIARAGVGPGRADDAWGGGLTLSAAAALDEARAVMTEGAGAAAQVAATSADPGNAFIREGEYWSLSYAGTVARLRDSKGLRDIARLLADAGRGVAAVDLIDAGRQQSERASAANHSDLGLHPEGDAGETLDAAARSQYRARVVDLDDDIGDAEAAHDLERASRAREERDFLLAELGAAVGLGRRPRRALDPAERARKAVAWRVRDAIGRIEAEHPALGRHLRRAVRTGSICAYEPGEPTQWRLSTDRP